MNTLARQVFRICPGLMLLLVAPPWPGAPAVAAGPEVLSVRDFGAKGDGRTDDTAAFQKALDAAGQGGGTVSAGRGSFFFAGHLKVPSGVTLEGIWKSVPAHTGIRDRGQPKPTDDGTTFLITEGAGKEDGPAFLTLNTNSTLKGVVLYYPNQKTDDAPTPYPYAIAMRGNNPAVLQVELLNPYNGIDATHNNRHLIRDVSGQPLRRGVIVNAIYDIGRIENVHFNPWWSMQPKLFHWQMENGEAFLFGRTDWQYVFNTFCFGYRVGYRFLQTREGLCNGNFLGIGADDCYAAVVVDASSPIGILITNGEFVSFHGPDPTMVVVAATNRGPVRFVNCAFWGPCHQIARIAGRGTIGFGDCTFMQWDSKREGRPALRVESGSVLVRGCEFQENKPQIELGEHVRRAVISDNLFQGPARIANRSKGAVKLANNAEE
ncbi:MAG TPA: glycosyl hydrolase family 28-related protein [Isosphaeraceae bacterium]|nr:glycosyl hydrolase family 28-related protein [Isosphaeraceae bacterium]